MLALFIVYLIVVVAASVLLGLEMWDRESLATDDLLSMMMIAVWPLVFLPFFISAIAGGVRWRHRNRGHQP